MQPYLRSVLVHQKKSRRFVQIMVSKVEECVEHCVHVCKAAVIDLAEPLLTQCCLVTGYGWDGDA